MISDVLLHFIDRRVASGVSERASKDLFLAVLCDALGASRTDPATGDRDRDRDS